MRRAISLSIPQPCSESWAAMTPTATGRHCAACAKTVVDFTQRTDAEILVYLAGAASGRTCGRFAAGQLERPLQRTVLAAPTRWRAWLAAVVAVWSLRETAGTAAKAQTPMEMRRKVGAAIVPSDQLRTMRKPDYEEATGGRILRGVVVDAATHEVLPGVTVLLKDTQIGTSTKSDGSFELVVPVELAVPTGVNVRVSSVGYQSQLRMLSLENVAVLQNFQLQASQIMLGGAVFMSVRRPWPWHPRSFYNRSKYWLTRPFRRS